MHWPLPSSMLVHIRTAHPPLSTASQLTYVDGAILFHRKNVLYSLCILTFDVIMSRLSEHVLPQVVGVEGVEQHSLRQSDQCFSLSNLPFSVSFNERRKKLNPL
jgi:hypothetical protein